MPLNFGHVFIFTFVYIYIPSLSFWEKPLPMLFKETLKTAFLKKNSEVYSGNDKQAGIKVPGIMTNKTAGGQRIRKTDCSYHFYGLSPEGTSGFLKGHLGGGLPKFPGLTSRRQWARKRGSQRHEALEAPFRKSPEIKWFSKLWQEPSSCLGRHSGLNWEWGRATHVCLHFISGTIATFKYWAISWLVCT